MLFSKGTSYHISGEVNDILKPTRGKLDFKLAIRVFILDGLFFLFWFSSYVHYDSLVSLWVWIHWDVHHNSLVLKRGWIQWEMLIDKFGIANRWLLHYWTLRVTNLSNNYFFLLFWIFNTSDGPRGRCICIGKFAGFTTSTRHHENVSILMYRHLLQFVLYFYI